MPFPHFAAGVMTALDEFFRSVAEKAAKLGDRLWLVIDKLLEKVPPEKRRLVLTASIGFCAVLLVIAGASLGNAAMTRGGDTGKGGAAAGAALRQGVIPADDLFLPDEPDFVPGILLEREQRAVWTADDAAPLWQDPLRNGEEPWRDRIERTIDEIMESVP